MVKFDVDSIQNVEVSKKFPCEKDIYTQLEIMEKYTDTHRKNSNQHTAKREVECLKVLFPALFRSIEKEDLIVGRLDFLPVGFGSSTSVGGAGHYCVFPKLKKMKDEFESEEDKNRVQAVYDYWLSHDIKTIYFREVLTETTTGKFIDCKYPFIATARLSGMMLDYEELMTLGIGGLRRKISDRLNDEEDNEFLASLLECLDIFVLCADELIKKAEATLGKYGAKRDGQLINMVVTLKNIREEKPQNFREALQLFWLFSMLAGVINYGRLDDFLGPFLAKDLEDGTLSEKEAYDYLKSLWTMIENRRTTVNGRIIVGGKGRKHPKEADVFLKIALKVAKDCRYVEPQFTLRVTDDTSDEIWSGALDAIGAGATYPTLYNDEINIPAVAYGMRVDEKTAEQYVPFGCTEFVIQGQSTGTPNVCINVLKILTFFLNNGVDPDDGVYKMGDIKAFDIKYVRSFEELYEKFKELLDYYIDLSVKAQVHSYDLMRREVSFLFTSILTNDCIEKGKSLIDGGVRYLGGTNEIYGQINASDSLYAIKKLVFDEKKYTLSEINLALLNNFEGYERLRKDLLDCDKYGNDIEEVDNLANDFYEHIAKTVRDGGIKAGMQYFLIVISNNQLNTEWGRTTWASPDGRLKGMYMNPANNPQGGANKSAPTAMLNSLSKFDAKYHAGSVQNIKFTPQLFNENREIIKSLFKAYFKKGGCHLMVTVVGKGVLEDAVKNPEKYKDLIVRVSGFSAVFVNLEKDIQEELMSRVLYE